MMTRHDLFFNIYNNLHDTDQNSRKFQENFVEIRENNHFFPRAPEYNMENIKTIRFRKKPKVLHPFLRLYLNVILCFLTV